MTADFIVEDQGPQLARLTQGADRRIDTHASAVFLKGAHVYKLKRAVRFSFMDFSTAEKRRAAAEREVTLNRRTAPDLYLGVAPIVAGEEGARLGEIGETPSAALDWVVVMRRFDEDSLFDRQAADGRLTAAKLSDLAREIARFHREAERVKDVDWASAAAKIARDTIQDMRADDGLDRRAVERLARGTEKALAERAEALAARSASVRRCHGDLHLRNICEIAGRPTLFDGIEFNDAFANIDPLYDLAFLLMDLDHRGLTPEAALVRDRWLEVWDDPAGQGLSPLYLSMRAAIRAKVSAAGAAVQEDPQEAAAMREEAARYLARAADHLRAKPVRLIAIGGFSGSGKSTLARAIAPSVGGPPGAVVVRTDQLRKARFGAAETAPLPADAYDEAVSVAVYAEMESRAAALLAEGVGVIADATFTHPESRARIEAAAQAAGVPFQGLWLDAPAEVMAARIAGRRGDASDADETVLKAQLEAGAGSVDWPRLTADRSISDLSGRALRMLERDDGRDAR
ncbi:MAG: AAA family ATPase [Marivibrio sp.]|uniref:bifunctional aminoglycoside phosphotransferase/ATP-binding protein n=1 Tax=Marivibrio sp. TaxID=2039719 RepID=UPI0032EAE6BF